MASESRKVVAGHFLSLDGVAEACERFVTAWDDETDAHGAALIAHQDAVILGRWSSAAGSSWSTGCHRSGSRRSAAPSHPAATCSSTTG